MAYGGLRGAVAFALILVVDGRIIHAREMMVTTIIAVVYFTVFLQGLYQNLIHKIKDNCFEPPIDRNDCRKSRQTVERPAR